MDSLRAPRYASPGDKMAFSKAFPREVPGGTPRWEEIFLTAQEEREQEQVARQANQYLMRQCIADAKNIVKAERMMDIQSHILSIALGLFKKRAMHAVYHKEEKCREKFHRYYGVLKGLKDARTKKEPDNEQADDDAQKTEKKSRKKAK